MAKSPIPPRRLASLRADTAHAGLAVVLGASGRLGPVIAQHLAGSGWHVIACSRQTGDLPGFDVLNPAWQRPERWKAALADHGYDSREIGGVVNLVAGRQSKPARAKEVGAAGVRAAAAAAALSPGTILLHLGSVSEQRAGRHSAYAQGKIAARDEARRLQISGILTVGVVPRAPGHPSDAQLRRLAERIPQMAALPLDVSSPEQVARGTEALLRGGWRPTGEPTPPTEITLAGSRRTLGEVLGCVPPPKPRPRLGTALNALLARLPTTTHTTAGRLTTFARLAAGRSESHYDTVQPEHCEPIADLTPHCRLVRQPGTAKIWLVADAHTTQEVT